MSEFLTCHSIRGGGRRVRSYDQFVPIARACMHYLTLTSIAETQHRVRRFRTHAAHSKGCEEVFQQLLAAGVSEDTLFDAVIDQQVEVVLTAHPTQVRYLYGWTTQGRCEGGEWW